MTSADKRLMRTASVCVFDTLIAAGSLYLLISGRFSVDTVSAISAIACVGCVAGIIAEIRGYRGAAAINIGIPSLLALLMASRSVWGPAIAHIRSPYYTAEQTEGDAFLMLFSIVPFCLALTASLLYWKSRVVCDSNSFTCK
jgi:hypothetical protein